MVQKRDNNSLHAVEKDKCVCQKFLNDIGVHAVPIFGEWRDSNWNRTEFAGVLKHAEYVFQVVCGRDFSWANASALQLSSHH